MNIERLNYLLTGEEKPKRITTREKEIIKKCLAIINEFEVAADKPVVDTNKNPIYSSIELRVLIRELKDGIKKCKKEGEMVAKSWGYEYGVL